jgi:hypothetical protein
VLEKIRCHRSTSIVKVNVATGSVGFAPMTPTFPTRACCPASTQERVEAVGPAGLEPATNGL